LSRGFQLRTVKKEYRARVAGLIAQDHGSIDLPIMADWLNRPRQKISVDGKPSLTRYRVLQRDTVDNSTLVALEPVTGRSHQLRIHLREIGHPIIGCDLYAPPEVLARSPRLLLHACFLGLHHPATGLWQEFHCPTPFQ
ncbi:MAG: RNA pseudouridine synthase, partial [Gammaproteobacteria bacterium HGW-Gammaproteobacteria-14]